MHVIVVMGVSGAGKTLVGSMLAAEMGWSFEEGDDHHSPENVAKMAHGEPLTDEDREPWLAALHSVIVRAIADETCVVVACSALKESYRRMLTADTAPDEVRFVYLDVPPNVLLERLRHRRGHFVHSDLLPSQLATLERPADAVWIDGTRPPAEIVQEIRRRLHV